MKRVVLALSLLVSMPCYALLFPDPELVAFYEAKPVDEVALYLDKVYITSLAQYERLEKILHAIDEVQDKDDIEIALGYMCQKLEIFQIPECIIPEIEDDMVQEVLSEYCEECLEGCE
jgi:hypothetical protein